jgi:hypothetical protein
LSGAVQKVKEDCVIPEFFNRESRKSYNLSTGLPIKTFGSDMLGLFRLPPRIKKDKSEAGMAAPPKGLVLERVVY